MNEAQTRFNKIDPKLRDAGWGIVPGSNILVEQSAYIAPTLVTKMRQIAKRKILNFHNKKPSTFTIKNPQLSQLKSINFHNNKEKMLGFREKPLSLQSKSK